MSRLESMTALNVDGSLEAANDTIRQLAMRVATLERLLQGVPSAEVARMVPATDYEAIRDFRENIRGAVDPSSTCAVVSRGDDRLLLLGGRPAWHFPRLDDGTYAGYYPGDDEAAIAHLEYVRSCGADLLAFPDSQLWWLDHYRDFSSHLEHNYERVIDEPGCQAYSLRERKQPGSDSRSQVAAAIRVAEEESGEPPTVLDLTTSNWGRGIDHAVIVEVITDESTLPFEGGTVDFVLLPADRLELLPEARRVSSQAVCVLTPEDTEGRRFGAVSIERHGVRDRRLPSASIIIPTYNGAEYMRACLRAINDTVPLDLDVEIIVADDGSTDNTAPLIKQWQARDSRIRLNTSPRNRGFIDNTNAGAATATGDMLVLLNNDTVPLDGWLTGLLRTFKNTKNVGVAGGKLLFPDGRLQEAGGVIFRDATGANFGKWDPKPLGPLYGHLRDVDFCSGALLATPRALFEQLGGLDIAFRPAYYEDSDYCFQVRREGLRVVYQPESTIVHIEGGTSGTDLSAGPKRAQVKNRRRFLEKWRGELATRPKPPTQYDLSTWYRLAYGQEAI